MRYSISKKNQSWIRYAIIYDDTILYFSLPNKLYTYPWSIYYVPMSPLLLLEEIFSFFFFSTPLKSILHSLQNIGKYLQFPVNLTEQIYLYRDLTRCAFKLVQFNLNEATGWLEARLIVGVYLILFTVRRISRAADVSTIISGILLINYRY